MGFTTDSETFSFEKRWLAPHGGRITWSSFAEYLNQIESHRAGNNIVPLAGHGTLRKRVMGQEDRAATLSEMRDMERELAAAMESGAWGISSGLEYPPSSFATESELIELSKVVANWKGLYATHLRNEGDTLVEAVQEALNVAGSACVPLQLSHHKSEGKANWGKVNTTLKMVEDARARGVDVQMDQYPYTAFMTSLGVQTLPRHALTGTPEEISARLQDPVQRSSIRAEMLAAHPDWSDVSADSPWTNIQIGVCRQRPQIQGRTISALAIESNVQPVDFVLELLSDGGYVSAINFAIGEEDIATVMRYPWTSIGSDGSGTDPHGAAAQDMIHPRTYGTFTRVLGRYVRDIGVLRLGEAIYRMTGLPAARMGLVNRGRIAVGCFADITIFSAESVNDRATFDQPHQLSSGIRAVLVNGEYAMKDGALTGELPGRVLRKGRA
jgi:N-acyl-D-amino-acid deacylase